VRPRTRRFGFADLEPGDRLGGGGDLGEQLVAVIDAEGVIGGLDGDGAAGVADADVDALPGDDESAPAADPPLHPTTHIRDKIKTRVAETLPGGTPNLAYDENTARGYLEQAQK
jgi:hypothetical protein